MATAVMRDTARAWKEESSEPITNVTPFEPGWEGYVTLEISNTTPLPAKIYATEGIAQVIFLEADEECEVSYADRKGKYQGQTGVTPARL